MSVLLIASGVATGLLARIPLRAAVAPVAAWPVAVLSAAALAVVASRLQAGGWPARWLPVPWVLTVFAVPLALADLRHRRLPDVLTLPAYPAIAAALAAAAWADTALGVRAALGVVVFGVAHAVLHLCSPASLGAGDVKLAGSLGAVLAAVGWPAVVLGAVAAALLSAALAAAGAVRRFLRPAAGQSSAARGVPHGPGLLAATWLFAVFPAPGSGVAGRW
ncbi:prepilin peptidase [Amycolatopsis sp. H20-H5]|uniref:prepilin peptidase n=1 Tax=Amycolatopsis sp. H20-H5 TaxID=3046309 RepID=UPI003FA3921C